MEKVWLKQYPEGVPEEIDPAAYGSLVEVFDESVRRYPDNPSFRNFGATLTYAQLERRSRAFAACLQQELGLSKGDRVAIMMPNLLQYPVALFGTLRAGMVVVNTNPLYTTRELRHQLADSGARAIVIVENFASVLEACVAETPIEHVIVTRMGDLLDFPKSLLLDLVVKYVKRMVPAFDLPGSRSFRSVLARGEDLEFSPPEVSRDDIAFLQYTGGTTGVAKGAMLTHGNMVANMEQAAAWLKPFISPGEETVITALPLYHIFALSANCMTFMRSGGLNHMITNPRDMPGFVKELKGARFTAITGVNTLFNGLLNTSGFDEVDFSALGITIGGGMAVQRSVAERWQKVTGGVLLEAYGLTETSPAVCINPLDASEFTGSIGLPVPSTEVCIRDDDDNELGFGEPGELCVRGPQVMKGYWGRPEETGKCLSPDGWLRTGDIASIDEKGFVYIVDRKKDLIIVSGFNVYPNEIEDVVAMHPGVLEVGAIGVDSEESGERVKVLVVKGDPGLTEEQLLEFCSDHLTAYKRPKYVQFVDELPKTNVGKILRRELRERFGGT